MTKWIVMVLLGALAIFQYQWWTGVGGIPDIIRLKKMVSIQKAELEALAAKNQNLDAEVQFLKEQPLGLEERARYELGMIKQGETFFIVIEPMR